MNPQETCRSEAPIRIALAASLLSLAACGGGGGNSGTVAPGTGTTPNSTWTAGVFRPSSSFANQCASPRTGNDPSGQPYPDTRGSVLSENNWLRSWTNELYLWYSEVTDRDPGNYQTAEYFNLLKTTQTTPSGTAKDQFHFTYPTSVWDSFSQSGVSAGYGANFVLVNPSPPRSVRVAFVEAGSPAAIGGLVRGDEIMTVDGHDVATSNNTSALNAGLFPSNLDENHTLQIRNNGVTRVVTLRSANVTSAPVHTVKAIPTASGPVGYILFNDHIATAEQQLIDAVNILKPQNIVDLVLDVRYNGGGYLAIASQLSYMIAGGARTGGQTFERTIFNDKHPATNPVTGQALQPTPFIPQTVGLSAKPAGVALPTFTNLNRVFVLTSDDTCSASESIINGLRGIDVPVIQIGTTTCGKPYGFYDFDNCGTTYFSIQFKGVNAKNFGDYADGFSPQNTQGTKGEPVQGCSVADDFSKELGDPLERMLSVALGYRMNSSLACPPPPAALSFSKHRLPDAADDSQALRRPGWKELRILDAGAAQ